LIIDNKLEVFERFEFIERKPLETDSINGNLIVTNATWQSGTSFVTANTGIAFGDGTVLNADSFRKKDRKPLLQSIGEFLFNPVKYFNTIKNSVHTMNADDYLKFADGINKIYNDAEATGQTALKEKMEKEKERIQKELQIIKQGVSKYILEEDIVKFSKNSARRIKLDWVKNFVRLIPTDIQEKVAHVEKSRVFDNYVILHYDPEDTGTADTQKEIERKKDPIIFGVCSCSRRLYYIGDWIDEYCDLTLDKLLKGIGETEQSRALDAEKITVPEDSVSVRVKKKRASRKRKARKKER
jgi:hypothetical protein